MRSALHKIISRAEVLKHNNRDDCWIIIKNKVYDLTDFVKSHPGGENILLARAGEDATSFFISKHGRNKYVTNVLKRYKIGELPDFERIEEKAFEEPFFNDLLKICEQKSLFKVSSNDRFRYSLLRGLFVMVFLLAAYLSFYTNLHLLIAIPLVILQALISTSLFGFIAHEHTHRDFPKNKALNFLLKLIWPLFWPFISQGPLRYEHNSHHVKIGDPEFDYEVAAFSEVIRYSGMVSYRERYKFQHKIARYIYPFYANIITTVGGVVSGFWEKHNRNVIIEHSLSLFTTFAFFVIIPSLLFGSFFKFILLYLIYQCTLFFGIYIGAAINHFIPAVVNEIPERFKNYYAYYVCANTSNFAVQNPVWFLYTGGFNIQVEHHLLPFVPVENLRKLVPIVKQLCEKYNYPYIDYRYFKDLWSDHYSYLAELSENKNLDFIDREVLNKKSYQAR